LLDQTLLNFDSFVEGIRTVLTHRGSQGPLGLVLESVETIERHTQQLYQRSHKVPFEVKISFGITTIRIQVGTDVGKEGGGVSVVAGVEDTEDVSFVRRRLQKTGNTKPNTEEAQLVAILNRSSFKQEFGDTVKEVFRYGETEKTVGKKEKKSSENENTLTNRILADIRR
jgi:hypothetical protein